MQKRHERMLLPWSAGAAFFTGPVTQLLAGAAKPFLAGVAALFLAGAAHAEHRTFELSKETPGRHLVDLAIDTNGRAFAVAMEQDEADSSRIDPADPSSLFRIPMRRVFLQYDPETEHFAPVSSDSGYGEQILFGPDGQTWIRSAKSLVCRTPDADRTVLELPPDEGLLRSMAVDRWGNLWVGGLKTGLYRIQPDLEWTHFTTENSELPSNSMTCIHVAYSGDLWIALWYNIGVWQVTGLSDTAPDRLAGTLHEASSTAVPLQAVWTIASDGQGVVWFGAGAFQNQPATLVRFAAGQWSEQELAAGCIEPVPGSVRRLAWDGTKLWVQASLGAGPAPRRSCVATLAGDQWSPVPGIPDDADVLDLEADPESHRVWVATLERAEQRTVLHSYSAGSR